MTKTIEKKYREKVSIDKINLKSILIDPLTTNNAVYRDSLTLTKLNNTKSRLRNHHNTTNWNNTTEEEAVYTRNRIYTNSFDSKSTGEDQMK